MTGPQRRALEAMATRGPMSPADIAAYMDPRDGRRYPMSGQGLGRIGGTMAQRLIRAGWAVPVRLWPPTYTITAAGRAAVAAEADQPYRDRR